MADETLTLSAVEPLDAERAVLGALINDESAWDKIRTLQVSDFSEASHRMIFEAILALENDGKPVDLVTASDQLRRHADYHEHPEILDYTRYIADENFTSERIEHYVRIVLNCSAQRQLRRACSDIIALINDPQGLDSDAIVSEAERLILEVSDTEKRGRDDFVRIRDSSAEASREMEYRQEWVRKNPNKQLLTGTPIGFDYFDRKTSGLQPGELVVLAAGPSTGKTSLAMNIAFNVAGGGIPGHEEDVVAVFSMEMSARQLADRMLAMVGQVDQAKMRSGRLNDANWRKIESALGLLAKPNLYVYEVSSPTPALIRRMSRRLRANHGNKLDLIVIDYLQLIPGDSRHESNRNAELAVITRELKAIAVELETPVLCLSQLNREGAGRAKDGEAPVLQQLRDSGAIEQDADIVMFLYNVTKDESTPESDTAETELKVAKNRNGPTFTMKLNFTKKHFHFVEPSPVDYQGETPQDYGYSS